MHARVALADAGSVLDHSRHARQSYNLPYRMLKLYKYDEDVLRYHEAWVNSGTLYEHWGVVGERGETRQHPLMKDANEDTAILEVLRQPAEAGFRPIEMGDHAALLIEYAVVGFGDQNDLAKRHALEDRMNETLGWTALGACDGGSSGSDSMEVCCLVVDYKMAKRVITADLAGTEFSDYRRIFNPADES